MQSFSKSADTWDNSSRQPRQVPHTTESANKSSRSETSLTSTIPGSIIADEIPLNVSVTNRHARTTLTWHWTQSWPSPRDLHPHDLHQRLCQSILIRSTLLRWCQSPSIFSTVTPSYICIVIHRNSFYQMPLQLKMICNHLGATIIACSPRQAKLEIIQVHWHGFTDL